MGAGNPTISRETETQVPAACQPQPRQPHIIKLISQLQKPTRRITDTWIIDTGKRETRYRLVKVHQTVRQPHNRKTSSFRNIGSNDNWLAYKYIIRNFHLNLCLVLPLFFSSDEFIYLFNLFICQLHWYYMYHTIYPFKLYKAVIFFFFGICDYHHHNLRTFSSLQKNHIPLSKQSP